MQASRRFIFAALIAVALGAATALGIAQVPQGAQSEGAVRNRPGANRPPEFPPPSILDYKPRSTLVVPQHQVPRAKYPVIDFHSSAPVFASSARIFPSRDDTNRTLPPVARTPLVSDP